MEKKKIVIGSLIATGLLAIGFKLGYDYSGTEIIRTIDDLGGYVCFDIKDMITRKKYFIGAHWE